MVYTQDRIFVVIVQNGGSGQILHVVAAEGRTVMPANLNRRTSLANRIGMFAIAVVVTVLTIVILRMSSTLSKKVAQYRAHNIKLQQELSEEQGRTQMLEQLPEYIQSDEYVEMIARQKFGLAYADEIVFKAEE